MRMRFAMDPTNFEAALYFLTASTQRRWKTSNERRGAMAGSDALADKPGSAEIKFLALSDFLRL